MTPDSHQFTERKGAGYMPGGPVLFVFHDGDENEDRFIDFAAGLFPEAVVIAPRIDGADDLAAQTRMVSAFLDAQIERLGPSRVVGLGYSGGAGILAGAMLRSPQPFSHGVLMHPVASGDLEGDGQLAGLRMLVTAGGRDPLSPPDRTGQLIDALEARGATVKSAWHAGGHEIAQSERDAVAEFMTGIRAGLADSAALPVEREQDEAGKGRYLIRGPADTVAEMSYRLTGPDQMIIDHTEVPDAFRGKGAGLRLLEALVADAQKEGRKIIPLCPFAAAQFERHPEWSDRLAYRIRTKRT